MSSFSNATLMITGGTGSFGNTVLKHFLHTDIGQIRIFSRDEKKQDDMRHALQVQHPEFETFMGEGSVHKSMFTCADCHMAKETNAAGETYSSHYWTSPLESETIMATCAACHADLKTQVAAIQAHAEERTIAIATKLETLTNQLADAVASGNYTEDELTAIRNLNRKGQFYWDFVFVENSEGAHNSKLTEECLDKAEAIVDEALALIKI